MHLSGVLICFALNHHCTITAPGALAMRELASPKSAAVAAAAAASDERNRESDMLDALQVAITGPSLHHHRTITAPSPHHHCAITAPSPQMGESDPDGELRRRLGELNENLKK